MVDIDKIQNLIEDAQQGNEKAIESLLVLCESVIRHYVNAYRWSGVPIEDLLQVGRIGVCKALNKYQLDGGASFTFFCRMPVRDEIREEVCRWLGISRSDMEKRYKLVKAQRMLSSHLGHEPGEDELETWLGLSASEIRRLTALVPSKPFRSPDPDEPDEPFSLEELPASPGERNNAHVDRLIARLALRDLDESIGIALQNRPVDLLLYYEYREYRGEKILSEIAQEHGMTTHAITKAHERMKQRRLKHLDQHTLSPMSACEYCRLEEDLAKRGWTIEELTEAIHSINQ
jgi:RNA polymerase sigma factor (sigma-70 family)